MTVAILFGLCAIFLIGLYAIYIWFEQMITNHQKYGKVLFDGQQELINELYERVKVLEQKSNNSARKPRQK